MSFRVNLQRRLSWLERNLRESNWKRSAGFIRDISKLTYTEEQEGSSARWHDRYIRTEMRIDTILQREVYLLEEISAIENKGAKDDDGKTLIDAEFELAREEQGEEEPNKPTRLEALPRGALHDSRVPVSPETTPGRPGTQRTPRAMGCPALSRQAERMGVGNQSHVLCARRRLLRAGLRVLQ